jgi:5-methylcytosine-specific restriction endonuclease McrA
MASIRTEDQKSRSRENSRRWRAANPERSREIIRRQYENYKARVTAGEILPQYKLNPEKSRANARAYYEAHKSECLESAKAWQTAHPDKVIAAKTKWRLSNVEKQRAATNRWQKEHRLENNVKAGRHRARKFGAVGFHTPEQLAARISYYGNRCAYCGAAYESVDHVIPLARGGSNWPANLRPACGFCNSSKADKLLSEWSPPSSKGGIMRAVAC